MTEPIPSIIAGAGTAQTALNAPERLSLSERRALAAWLGLATAESAEDITLHDFLRKKAEELGILADAVADVDFILPSLSDLKEATLKALSLLDLDEADRLLREAREPKTGALKLDLGYVKKFGQIRADVALLRGELEDAFRILLETADRFDALDADEPVRQLLTLEWSFHYFGLRYGPPGFAASKRMIETAIDRVDKNQKPELWAEAQKRIAFWNGRRAEELAEALVDASEVAPYRLAAISAYRAALGALHQARTPEIWGTYQYQLAWEIEAYSWDCHWCGQPTLFDEAAEAYRAALSVLNQDRASHRKDWAQRQYALGRALHQQGLHAKGDTVVPLLHEAVEALRASLLASADQASSKQWASRYEALGKVLRDLGTRLDGPRGIDALTESKQALEKAVSHQAGKGPALFLAQSTVEIALTEEALADHPATQSPEPHLASALGHVSDVLDRYATQDWSGFHEKWTALRERLQSRLNGN